LRLRGSREYAEPGPKRPGDEVAESGNKETEERMSLYDTKLAALDGSPDVLAAQKGNVTLMVNVASFCGLTPQYTGLEELHEKYASNGFSVIGIPCNQFGAQEPGTADEIATFCSTNYGVTFPLTEKIEVNGDGRHPLYQELTKTPDAEGTDGDIRWNFEKFLVNRNGEVVARFSPLIEPANEDLVTAIEKEVAS
jgi:glutathione peroxidase